jgi:hypothetical protein
MTMMRSTRRTTSGWGSGGIPVPGDVLAALDELGIQAVKLKDGEAWAYCPGHPENLGRQESKPDKWSVNLTSGQHSCFSCGFEGSFVFLVQEVLNVSREDAAQWVRSRGGIERVRRYLSAPADREQFVPRREWNESRLALFGSPPQGERERRRLSEGSVDHYGVLWDRENAHWILPVRDPDTFELWGYQEKGDGYFDNKPARIPKGQTLFGIDVLEGPMAVLLESPLDCLRLYTAGIMGGVASYGAKVTDAQMDLLFDRVNVIVIALDNDDAGREQARKLRQRYLRSGKSIKFLNYSGIEGKDIGEPGTTDTQIRNAVMTSVALPLARI